MWRLARSLLFLPVALVAAGGFFQVKDVLGNWVEIQGAATWTGGSCVEITYGCSGHNLTMGLGAIFYDVDAKTFDDSEDNCKCVSSSARLSNDLTLASGSATNRDVTWKITSVQADGVSLDLLILYYGGGKVYVFARPSADIDCGGNNFKIPTDSSRRRLGAEASKRRLVGGIGRGNGGNGGDGGNGNGNVRNPSPTPAPARTPKPTLSPTVKSSHLQAAIQVAVGSIMVNFPATPVKCPGPFSQDVQNGPSCNKRSRSRRRLQALAMPNIE